MAAGKYDIQFLLPSGKWQTDLGMQMMVKDFAKGCFFAIKSLIGGNTTYRLIKRDNGEIIELDQHHTGQIKLN